MICLTSRNVFWSYIAAGMVITNAFSFYKIFFQRMQIKKTLRVRDLSFCSGTLSPLSETRWIKVETKTQSGVASLGSNSRQVTKKNEEKISLVSIRPGRRWFGEGSFA